MIIERLHRKVARSGGGAQWPRRLSGLTKLLGPAKLLAAAIFLLAAGAAASAGAEATSGPTVLTGAAISETAPGETRVVLTFNQILPQYSIVSNDNEHIAVALVSTVRGSGASVSPGAHSLLKSVDFAQNGIILTMNFAGVGPVHVEATPGPGNSVKLEFTEVKRLSKAGDAAAGPLPAYVDRKSGEDEFEVVPLRYADVSEVVGLISSGQAIRPNDTFTPQEPAFGSSGISGGGGPGANNLVQQNLIQQNADAASTAYGQLVDDSIGVDRRLNAIILRGTPERIARLKEKIARLDVPVTSVLLETVFVELTETGAKNVGLDFTNSSGQIAVATYQFGNFAANNTALRETGQGSASLQAAIYAQVQKGEGRILSRPRISAQSGTSAKIITGDALPILTSIALSGVNAVSQQVQYVNVGVTLQIAPRVSDDGFVTSHIFCEVSSVTGFSQGYPTISQREASTSATVKDGDYFVIGGLTQENELTTKSHVPLLGNIPGVGELFKLQLSNKSKTQLYIVVTPHIASAGNSAKARAQIPN